MGIRLFGVALILGTLSAQAEPEDPPVAVPRSQFDAIDGGLQNRKAGVHKVVPVVPWAAKETADGPARAAATAEHHNLSTGGNFFFKRWRAAAEPCPDGQFPATERRLHELLRNPMNWSALPKAGKNVWVFLKPADLTLNPNDHLNEPFLNNVCVPGRKKGEAVVINLGGQYGELPVIRDPKAINRSAEYCRVICLPPENR